MFLGTNQDIALSFDNTTLRSQNEVLLLGITIDSKLYFTSHITNICKTANNKLNAINRLRSSLSINQTRVSEWSCSISLSVLSPYMDVLS